MFTQPRFITQHETKKKYYTLTFCSLPKFLLIIEMIEKKVWLRDNTTTGLYRGNIKINNRRPSMNCVTF